MVSTILTIDNGTQSVRALLFDTRGELLAKTQVKIDPYFSAQPGWAEQHASVYWDAVCQACRALWDEPNVDKASIKGMAVTTQRQTMFNIDKDGEPLRPGTVWMDQRTATQVPKPPLHWQAAFKLAGVTDIVDNLLSQAESNWFVQHQPEIWNKTKKFIMLSGWLNYQFTGEFVDSVAAQVGYIPFDYKKLDWLGRFDWRWKTLQIKKSQMPTIKAPGEQLGTVTADAASATGIPAGLPVIAAASDKACEILGGGGRSPDVGCVSFGTQATFGTATDKYLEVAKRLPPFPGAIPGTYHTELQIYRGFWMVSWFKEEFGSKERKRAKELGMPTEALFDEMIAEVPAGSMGLMLQPYWTPGIRQPGPEAKGAIIGWGDVHKRPHMYRAILEGIVYELRSMKERTEKRTKTPIRELRVSGGGSQSVTAMQITADIFGLPVSRPHVFETSGLGAAIDAAVGLGLHPDFDTAIASMTRTRDTFEPNPDTARFYDELYQRVYTPMYKRLKPLYENIKDITGYPE